MPKTHQSCPDCGRHKCLTIFDNGNTYCHSCKKKHYADNSGRADEVIEFEPVIGDAQCLNKRRIDQNTCNKFDYLVGTYHNKIVQISNYRDKNGVLKFQKIRTANKEFEIVGKFEPILYGQHLWNGHTKKIIITEGEIDCLSVYQVNGGFPVVSLPNGAASASKVIKAQLEWLNKFEEIVIMFDMDEAGKQATQEVAALLPLGKCKIAELPEKDANEMLKKGLIKELVNCIHRAAEFRPDGIVTGIELWDEICKEVEEGISYPFPTLTQIAYGIRVPELIVFGAGTGMGKTEFFKEIEAHLILQHNQNVGIIHLEETIKDTTLGLMSKALSKKFHIPKDRSNWTDEDKAKAFEMIAPKAFIYDAFGSTDIDTITNIIRYLVVGKDCKYVFLDHITALADGISKANEVNQAMRNIVSDLASLTRELGFTLFTISHLRKADGNKTHEEGGRVHLDDLLGASALKQWASYVFGLERNQQAQDIEERHTTTLRCLKDRYTGQAAGETIQIKYQEDTGRLLEKIISDLPNSEGEEEAF